MKSMSPYPRRLSAPFASRIVRESTLEKTLHATLAGKFALMMPGEHVHGRPAGWQRIRWMPEARAIWARRAIYSSTSLGETIMRSASSSMTHHDIGQGLAALLLGHLLVVFFLCSLRPSPPSWSIVLSISWVIHMSDVLRILRIRDHRKEEMGNALIEGEFEHLEVDHEEILHSSAACLYRACCISCCSRRHSSPNRWPPATRR